MCESGTVVPSAVLKNSVLFMSTTARKDSPQGPPTANRRPATAAYTHRNGQPPTATNRQPLFKTASVILCLAHVLTIAQRASL